MRARYITPNSHAQNIANEIGCAIVLGRYSDLEKLPSDAEFAVQFGVSRNVIREAFSFLNSKNLVTRKASQGTTIDPENQWDILDKDVLNWITQREFSTKLLNELNQLRVSIEPAAAALSATRRTHNHLQNLDSTIIKIQNNKDDVQHLAPLLANFHIDILTSSQNRFYRHFSYFMKTALSYQDRIFYGVGNQFHLDVSLYKQLICLIKDKRAKQAKLAMREILKYEYCLISTIPARKISV